MVIMCIGDPKAVNMHARGQGMVTSGREWVTECAGGQVPQKQQSGKVCQWPDDGDNVWVSYCEIVTGRAGVKMMVAMCVS